MGYETPSDPGCLQTGCFAGLAAGLFLSPLPMGSISAVTSETAFGRQVFSSNEKLGLFLTDMAKDSLFIVALFNFSNPEIINHNAGIALLIGAAFIGLSHLGIILGQTMHR